MALFLPALRLWTESGLMWFWGSDSEFVARLASIRQRRYFMNRYVHYHKHATIDTISQWVALNKIVCYFLHTFPIQFLIAPSDGNFIFVFPWQLEEPTKHSKVAQITRLWGRPAAKVKVISTNVSNTTLIQWIELQHIQHSSKIASSSL